MDKEYNKKFRKVFNGPLAREMEEKGITIKDLIKAFLSNSKVEEE